MKWAIMTLALVIGIYFLSSRPGPSGKEGSPAPPALVADSAGAGAEQLRLPEIPDEPLAPFFESYGSQEQSPDDDLRNVAAVIQSYHSIIKLPDSLDVMSNQTILRSLRGQNPHRARFISEGHPLLSAQGELLDRWGSPLHFHPESVTKLSIRSAGPDRELFTQDDLVQGPQ